MSPEKLTRITKLTSMTIDGKTYSNVDEMPPEVRARYEELLRALPDKDSNGVPDLLEGNFPGEGKAEILFGRPKVIFDGDLGNLPPDVRRQLDEYVRSLNAGGTGDDAQNTTGGTYVVTAPTKHVVMVDGQEIDLTNVPPESRKALLGALGGTQRPALSFWLGLGVLVAIVIVLRLFK